MAEYFIQSETLDDIADAIIKKTGAYGKTMTPAEMVTAIAAIPSGSNVSEIITVGENTVSNMTEAQRYLLGLATLDMTSNKYLIQIETGYASPSNNQVGSIINYNTNHAGTFSTAKRYRNGWNSTDVGIGYDAILVEGTSYKITVLG